MSSLRRNKIRELLQAKPFISLHDLEAMFPDVSSMTLRRDIEYFEKQGEAIKVRGGARSMKFITTSMEDAFSRAFMKMPAQRKRSHAVRLLFSKPDGRYSLIPERQCSVLPR